MRMPASKSSNKTRAFSSALALRVGLLAAMAAAAQAGTLLQDNFNIPGPHLDFSTWTTVTGPPSFLGRTQLANWTPGRSGQFVVGVSGAQLALNTFNPTCCSLYGTHAGSLASFQPTWGA